MAESLSGPHGPVTLPGARPRPVVSRRALLRGLGNGAAALAAAAALLPGMPAGAMAGLPPVIHAITAGQLPVEAPAGMRVAADDDDGRLFPCGLAAAPPLVRC
jgi:hypothetical protein